MRIVQVWSALESGGAGKATLDFIQELVQQGHKPVVISAGGALVARLKLHGIEHIQLPLHKKPVWSQGLVRRLRSALEELQADVIHVHGRLPALLVWRAWRKMPKEARPRLVTQVDHCYPPSRGNAALVAGDSVIASSQCVADYLNERYGVQQVRVIHRGVSHREFDRSKPVSGQWQLRLLNDYPQLEGKNWWLYTGALSPEGELEVFLRSLSKAILSREDIQGLVVGTPQEDDLRSLRKLEQLAQRLGLDGKVLFLGARQDMRELYASSQLFFSLAGPRDPCGKNAMAALAMGCPVIAYKDSCAGEVVKHCFPQGLIERGNLEALADVALGLMNKASKVELHSFFHTDIVRKTLNLYWELHAPSQVDRS
ncbi:glycosyltransferase [Microbulbifer epialgicus]|uniref:Glycosyltransferase n=1 Tax=Microbulbifer epialgicus TaxID=393907 RepID=A0ABV4NXN3_9GAMM